MSEAAATPAALDQVGQRQWRRFAKRFLRSRNVMAGSLVLLAVIVLVVLAPAISPYEPTQQFRRHRLEPPSADFLLGTDNLGRDILTRILYGGQVSLQVGIVSVAIGATLGTLLGLLAGYLGGWADVLIMRFIDMMLAFPGILLALVIIAVLGRNLQNVMIAVGLSSIPVYTRVVRGSTLALKQSISSSRRRRWAAPRRASWRGISCPMCWRRSSWWPPTAWPAPSSPARR